MAAGARKDPYALLGVARDANDDAVRTAYRNLARELHPDVNPDDPVAEERFKRVAEAYAVLSDPDKRAAYDEFGEIALDPNFDAEKAREAGRAFGGAFGGHAGGASTHAFGGNLDDLFQNLFSRGGGGFRGAPLRHAGPDVEAELTLDFLDAALGGEQRLTIGRPTADGGSRQQAVTVRIPPGVADGGRIRLRGQGGEGIGGGPPGDLYARIRVRPHPLFRREGRDLFLDVPISVREAILGAEVEVPLLDGRVRVSVPSGTDSGARLRLRHKGVPHPSGGVAGDLYVVIQIKVPRDLDDETRARIEALEALHRKDLRNDLG
ncbi:MAG: DnaJ C-terminal domain-containing protein [Myxococcota bacterium]